MKPINPGNVLAFWDKKRWQRHRQTGQDLLPFGLLAPNVRLLPFQLFFATGSAPEVLWQLVKAADEDVTITLSPGLLENTNRQDGGFWVTWKAEENLDQIPPCGYWYVKVSIGEAEYYSEVLQLRGEASLDVVGLELTGCNLDGGTVQVTVAAADQLSATPTEQTVEFYAPEITDWSPVGPTGGMIEYQEYPPNSIQIRRVVTMPDGRILTASYLATWTDAEDPCADLALTLTSTVSSGGSGMRESWRLRAFHTTDKGNVLYQTGYQQHLYLAPIWDTPSFDRDVNGTVNGNGDEVRRYTRTVERLRFEAPDLPDFALYFLKSVGDMDSVFLEDVTTDEGFQVVSLESAARRQGPTLNIGEFSFDGRIEVFAGCQPNFALE